MKLRSCLFLIFFSFLLSITIFLSCSDERYRSDEGMIWHTTYHITYSASHDMRDSILAALRDVDRSLNVFSESSLVSKLNNSDSITADRHLEEVYLCSQKIHALTNGAFDPTLSPIITAWGFGKGHVATADTARIDSIMKFVGLDKTELRNRCIIKNDSRTQFNFSAIAKGYGCDYVAAMFKRNGITDFLVEIGGEIRAGGISPSGKDWRISIDSPTLETNGIDHTSAQIISIPSGMGMATSGNYRNFHTDGNGHYGHTISATTGRPARTDVLSATVLSKSAMEADAFATAMMAMGSRDAIELAKDLDLPVMLILSDKIIKTKKFKNLEISQ